MYGRTIYFVIVLWIGGDMNVSLLELDVYISVCNCGVRWRWRCGRWWSVCLVWWCGWLVIEYVVCRLVSVFESDQV